MATEVSPHLQDVQRKIADTRLDITLLEEQLEDVENRIKKELENLGIATNEPKDPQVVLENAKKQFNKKPKHGIRYLKSNGYFRDGGTATEVAQFLYHEGADGAGLKKDAIGEYLGEHHDFNKEVLNAFAECHNFVGDGFDGALRRYLWSFRLPGESQKIDRMMESFAERYCSCNKSTFASTDGCYILAFATIMLNTSLHNPNVARKTTLEEFQAMNRGVDNGKDLSNELLVGVYKSITEVPFKIPCDQDGIGYVFLNPDRNGYLYKDGGRIKGFKRRWVVISGGVLYYFKQIPEGNDPPHGIVPMDSLSAVALEPKGDGLWYFEITGEPAEDGTPKKITGCKKSRKGMVVEGNHTRYVFRTEDEAEMREWVSCINANVRQHVPREDGPLGDAFANAYAKKMGSVVGSRLSMLSLGSNADN